MQTDGRTDMTKLIVAVCSFANAPKDEGILHEHKLRPSYFAARSSLLNSYLTFDFWFVRTLDCSVRMANSSKKTVLWEVETLMCVLSLWLRAVVTRLLCRIAREDLQCSYACGLHL